MIFTDVLKRFPDAVKNGTGFKAKCPAHADVNPSLKISAASNGGTLLNCHAGCLPEAVVAAVGLSLSDLFSTPLPKRPKSATNLPFSQRIEQTYDYQDEDGTLLFQSVRLHSPKDFRQRRPDGRGGWHWNLQGLTPVLYRLPELLAVSGDVFIVEGEKDVDRLRTLGFTVTCNPMGAGKWRAEYNVALTGRNVVILADNDQAGRAHAEAVARSLDGVAASMKVLALPNLPTGGGDVSDWIEAGRVAGEENETLAEKLSVMAESAPTWTQAGATSEAGAEPASKDAPRFSAPEYEALPDGLWWHQPTRNGRQLTPLTNFTAKVLREVIKDDGTELKIASEIEATLRGRKITGKVTPASYAAMRWPVELLGASAIIFPNRTEHARCAVSLLSGDIPQARVFAHTGWREVEGQWCYLHTGGGIGANGALPVSVELDGALADYRLPAPPSREDWAAAMRTMLELLDVLPEVVSIPALGAVWDAVLGGADYSIFIEGASGERKSAFTALLQACWGAAFTGDHLPANWQSTANANAEKQHALKDALPSASFAAPPIIADVAG